MKEHHYRLKILWTGNKGKGTKNYRAYSRNHQVSSEGKESNIKGSSDPSFRGDPRRYNPEELLVSSLSACHMLWFLHLCSTRGIIVTDYEDEASGTMVETSNGSGHFSGVVLRPRVTIQPISNAIDFNQIHEEAHKMCFIANSCNFPIRHESTVVTE